MGILDTAQAEVKGGSMVSEQQLERYADVITTIGLKIEAGDWLVIKTSLEQGPLVRIISARAYEMGADNVTVLFYDPETERTRFSHGSSEAWGEICHQADAMNQASAAGASFLRILDEDPELYAGIDPERVAIHNRAFDAARRPTIERIGSHQIAWSIVAAPGRGWAARVFPELDEDGAIERLWEAILRVCRVDQANPVAAWNDHLAMLDARQTFLTERRFDRLRYSGPGTDLTIGLPSDHRWLAGAKGRRGSVPNLPTEEVFTAPHRARVDGVVRATKPLSHLGAMIEDFELRFEAGMVVEAQARSGQSALDQLLATDEGAMRLGEAALVPQSSLVAAENLIWRNGLLDENDACHIAFGRAYPACVADGPAMSADERIAAGLNASDVHVDFVVGSTELDVVGVTADGDEEPLLIKGEWAFDA
jgi:aminopeptidase